MAASMAADPLLGIATAQRRPHSLMMVMPLKQR